MKMVAKQFGEKIRNLRLARNLSQEGLAFKAGVHRTYLGSIKRQNEAKSRLPNLGQALNEALPHMSQKRSPGHLVEQRPSA